MFVVGLMLGITELSDHRITLGVRARRPDGSMEIARQYCFEGVTQPNHTCSRPALPLRVGDDVHVVREQPGPDLLVKGPCGCDYMFYQRLESC